MSDRSASEPIVPNGLTKTFVPNSIMLASMLIPTLYTAPETLKDVGFVDPAPVFWLHGDVQARKTIMAKTLRATPSRHEQNDTSSLRQTELRLPNAGKPTANVSAGLKSTPETEARAQVSAQSCIEV